jgi:hypothetical protein
MEYFFLIEDLIFFFFNPKSSKGTNISRNK